MKAFVINLERAVERRTKVTRQLKKRKLDYEIIRAIDGKQLSDDELKRLCDLEAVKARPNRLTSGAIGCALSHLNVYQKILDENLEMALVLEDDVILPKEIIRLLDAIKERIQSNEVILLHYFILSSVIPLVSSQGADVLPNGYNLMYPVEMPLSGAAYVITREAARTMSEAKLPIRVEADDWTYFFQNNYVQSVRCVAPIPVRIALLETQIQTAPAQSSDRQPLHRRITSLIYDNKIPVFYQLLNPYREFRFRLEGRRAKIVDAPSPVWERLKKH